MKRKTEQQIVAALVRQRLGGIEDLGWPRAFSIVAPHSM